MSTAIAPSASGAVGTPATAIVMIVTMMSDSNNSVKLPIRVKGKNATNEYGVDQIYGGCFVYVEGYDQAFKVTIYENDVIKYLPFL